MLVQRTLPKEIKHFSSTNGLIVLRKKQDLLLSAHLNTADRVNKPEETQIYNSTKKNQLFTASFMFQETVTLHFCLMTYLIVVDVSGYRCSVRFRLMDSVQIKLFSAGNQSDLFKKQIIFSFPCSVSVKHISY